MNNTDLQEKLFTSVKQKDFTSMRRLLRLGADINAMDPEGETLLAIACRDTCTQNLVKVVAFLLKKGADVNKFQGNGHSPLFNAVKAYRPMVVKELLEKGANPNINFYPEDRPRIVSSALDLTYKRFIEAVVKEKKGFYDDFSVLQSEIYCLRSMMFLLTEAGARIHEKEVVPEYS